MRGLTKEEAVLLGEVLAAEVMPPNIRPFANTREVALLLEMEEAGRVAPAITTEIGTLRHPITALGRLALRVHAYCVERGIQ